jgi:hypothetical protein
LLEQNVEGGGKRRAGLPQLSITLARPVVRQAHQAGGSATLVELVVNQRDKFGVIIGHECDCQTPPISISPAPPALRLTYS